MFLVGDFLQSASIVDLIRKLKENNIPEADYQKYAEHYIENKARNQRIPLTGNFELTPLCNLDCKMCYVHLSNTQFDRSKLLSIDTWKSIISQAFNAGMRHASLTGGECLTFSGFEDVYLHLYALGIKPGILTNGLLLDDKYVDFFKKFPPKMIQVTVYGSSDDAYELVTGHRAFQRVYNNLIHLKETEIPFKISITPNIFMRDDVIPLLELLQRMDIPYNINANLIPPRKNTGRLTHDLTIDEYVEIFKLRSKMNHQELDPVDLAELPDESHSGTKRYGFNCGAGRSSFGIKYDGNMCPCLSYDEISVSSLDFGVSEAWRKINYAVNSYPQPEECGNCIYFDRCLPCIAMHKNAPIFGHCDPRICERTKKLISAGFIPVPAQKKDCS